MRRWLESTVCAGALALAGCTKDVPAPSTPPPSVPTPVAASVAAVQPTRPEPPGAAPGQAEPECAAPLGGGEKKSLTLAGRTATLEGTKLTFTTADTDGRLTLGVLGPFNEDSPANLAAIPAYLAFFAQEKVDAVVVAGDSGETEAGIARVLEAVAKAKVPVFVVIGNRECKADYANAVAKVAEKNPHVVNLNQVRVVELPEATLVSLPGYHDPNFINCAKGCRYFQSTVDEVARAAKEARSPVIVVSHGPPLGEGSQALDFTAAAGNVGDPALRKALADAGIGFGLFTHIKEAGARATDLAGTTVIAPDRGSRTLFLNPGPANTAKWKMNDGTAGYGFAAVFALQGQEARWKLFRLPPPGKAGAK